MLIRIMLVLLVAANAFAWDHLYKKYDALLHSQVKGGLVNYAALKDRPDELMAVQNDFEMLTAEEWETFSETQRLVFWINAYNLYTVRLVVDHHPLKTIKDLSAPWELKFIPIMGKIISLDDIRHGAIRKNFNEPRIHFALVCAARSCPVLQDWAYTAENMDSQLDEAGCAFLLDTTRNRVQPENKRIHVSSIFKWYGDDFKHDGRTYIDEISRLIGTAYSGKPKVKFMPYDWSLNERKLK